MNADSAVEMVRREALWFEPTSDGLGPLLDAAGNAPPVLLGEATHETHEFYRMRAELTKALISRRGPPGRGRSRLARCVPREPVGATHRDRIGCRNGL